MSQNYPIYELPYLYVNGFQITWLSITKLSISSGQCRDSDNIIDMPLGYPPVTNTYFLNTPITLNGKVNGVNGLDVGTLTSSSWYSIYVIGDSSYKLPIATLLSITSINGFTKVPNEPVLPKGYDSIRLIGYVQTDGSNNFIKFYQAGTGSERYYQWDASINTIFVSGLFSGFTSWDISLAVPPIDTDVYGFALLNNDSGSLDINYTAGLRVTGSSPSSLSELPVQFYPPASTANQLVTPQFSIITQLSSGSPTIDSFTSEAPGISTTMNLYITGFDFYI